MQFKKKIFERSKINLSYNMHTFRLVLAHKKIYFINLFFQELYLHYADIIDHDN